MCNLRTPGICIRRPRFLVACLPNDYSHCNRRPLLHSQAPEIFLYSIEEFGSEHRRGATLDRLDRNVCPFLRPWRTRHRAAEVSPPSATKHTAGNAPDTPSHGSQSIRPRSSTTSSARPATSNDPAATLISTLSWWTDPSALHAPAPPRLPGTSPQPSPLRE
jgi:hypothetical protein